ncbi:TonB-dependent receptor plug domain-containing protein [Komagataeibacter melomenusus]
MNTHHKPARLSKIVLLTGVVSVSCPPAGAWADPVVERITTTKDVGDVSPAFRTSTPRHSTTRVAIVTGADLLKTGQTNVIAALQQSSPEINAPPGGGGGGYSTTPTQTVILRNLNADETLVLVNGVRRHASAIGNWNYGPAQGTEPADLSLIPLSAIDHVEIVTEGATALYGQDAIGGAINIVLKAGSRNGGTANIQNSGYYRGDGQGITAYGDLERQLGTKGGGMDLAWQVQNQLPTHRDGINPTLGDVNRIEGLSRSLAELFSFNAHMPISRSVEAYGTATLAHRSTDRIGFIRGATNINNVPSLHPNGFEPIETFDEMDFQVNGGLRGTMPAGVAWNTYASFGREQVNEGVYDDNNPTFGALSQTSFNQGKIVNAELIGGAKFSKRFSSRALPKPAVLDWGLEYRHDTYQIGAGDYQSWATGPDYTGSNSPGATGYNGFQPSNAGNWSRDIFDGHVGLDIFVTRKWEWTIGGHVVNYSDTTTAPTGSIGTRYNFTKNFSIHANVNTGYRPPTLGAIHYDATSSGPGYTTVNLSQTNDVARLLGSHNPKGEYSRSYSIGLDWTPVRDLQLSVDGYRIDINDRIESTSAFSGTVMADYLSAHGVGDNITYASYMTNIGNTTTNGFTAKISYKFPIKPAYGVLIGSVQANAADTEMTHYASTPGILTTLGQTYFSKAAETELLRSSPKNKESFSLNWSKGRYSVFVQEQRYAGVAWLVYQSDPGAYWTHVRPQVITNLEASARVGHGFVITLGANNLFNKYPTRTNRQALKESSGVFAYPMTAPGGYEGGYYYARLGYTF